MTSITSSTTAITMPLPRSGCLTTSRIGTAARARTLRRSLRPRPSGRRAQNVATVTMSTRVAKAEGWICTPPICTQRVAPSGARPDAGEHGQQGQDHGHVEHGAGVLEPAVVERGQHDHEDAPHHDVGRLVDEEVVRVERGGGELRPGRRVDEDHAERRPRGPWSRRERNPPAGPGAGPSPGGVRERCSTGVLRRTRIPVVPLAATSPLVVDQGWLYDILRWAGVSHATAAHWQEVVIKPVTVLRGGLGGDRSSAGSAAGSSGAGSGRRPTRPWPGPTRPAPRRGP